MDMTLASCREFVSVLASDAPAPGGGGAAALVGAIGTALGNMVGSLTVGKKKYAEVEEEIIALGVERHEVKIDFEVGDTVKVTVSVSKDSKLVSFGAVLTYDATKFEVVSGAPTGAFSAEVLNTATAGTVKYAGAAATTIDGAKTTLFTVEFKILKTGGKITFNVDEAYVNSNGKDVDVTSACASASTKSITFNASSVTPTDYFNITEPSTKSISYKSGIVLHVNQTGMYTLIIQHITIPKQLLNHQR